MARRRNSNDRMTSISVPEKMHEFLIRSKIANEPIYVVLNRIISSYLADKADIEEDLRLAREGVQIWQRRALQAESQQVLFK